MTKQQTIDQYESACNAVLDKINNLYFEGEADIDWVGDEIGGTATIADYFFNMDYMMTALRHNASEKQFFGYYDEQLEKGGAKMNFKNYIKYYEGFNKVNKSKTEDVTCPICNMKFTYLEYLDSHIFNKHGFLSVTTKSSHQH